VDITENEKEIKLSAELPGMDEKDIDVSLQNNTLTIKGEKKEEKEDKGKDCYKMERSYGSFSRSIPVPVEVETDKVEAKFNKGVLSITLPKTAKAVAETKKIAVKVE
jgi:HSP20 family protein